MRILTISTGHTEGYNSGRYAQIIIVSKAGIQSDIKEIVQKIHNNKHVVIDYDEPDYEPLSNTDYLLKLINEVTKINHNTEFDIFCTGRIPPGNISRIPNAKFLVELDFAGVYDEEIIGYFTSLNTMFLFDVYSIKDIDRIRMFRIKYLIPETKICIIPRGQYQLYKNIRNLAKVNKFNISYSIKDYFNEIMEADDD